MHPRREQDPVANQQLFYPPNNPIAMSLATSIDARDLQRRNDFLGWILLDYYFTIGASETRSIIFSLIPIASD